MRKISFLFFAAVIYSLAACTAEESIIQEIVEDVQYTDKVITIRATREENPKTKTYRDASDGSVLWIPGDAISLFYGSGSNGGSLFTSNASDTSQVTNFTGTINVITGVSEEALDDTFFWGVYPYSSDISCDGSSVIMSLPSHQTAKPGTFATNTFPSIGHSQGLVMGFYNVCGGWRFSVTKEGVRKVTLKSIGGEPVAGKVKVGFNNAGVPEILDVIEGSDEVVLECPRGEYFEVGKNYYITLLPAVFESGLSVKFETYTEEGTYIRSARTTISRSGFSGITDLDNYLTEPYAPKTGNIPIEDPNFKAYLVENFDTGGDGEISYQEAAAITSINAYTDNIHSVQGIEYMINLVSLTCRGRQSGSGQLEYLDVSNNHSLAAIDCAFNRIDNLYFSKNNALSSLKCLGNHLKDLNVSFLNYLTSLDCSSNELTNLNISKNISLVRLVCSQNQLNGLDVSNNAALEYLDCWYNPIGSLDVSNNTALTYLNCWNAQLSSLDVSHNIALRTLLCGVNTIGSLDVSRNTALTRLDCDGAHLSTLDVSHTIALSSLDCGGNQLTILDVTNNSALQRLHIAGNRLTNLDLSNNRSLRDLNCRDNQIENLDLTNNTILDYLDCSMNPLSILNVDANTKLTYLICFSNQLSSLNVSENTLLERLECSYNQLTNLDVSRNDALITLICFNNLITSLDISHNSTLDYLDCSPMNNSNGNNLLETLYVAQDQNINGVTLNRSNNNVPDETLIIVGFGSGNGGSSGSINLSSANGDYIPEYWTNDFTSRYNQP